jgi:hypothetical protein
MPMWSPSGGNRRRPPVLAPLGTWARRPKLVVGLLAGVILVGTGVFYGTRPAEPVVAEQEELFPELHGFETRAADHDSTPALSQVPPGDEPELQTPAQGSSAKRPRSRSVESGIRTAEFRSDEESAVWLTGTIEEVEEPASLPRFPRADATSSR